MKLIAIYPILYRSRQYEIGEELPADDSEMVQAWLDAKTAVWQENKPKAKARPVTAQAGLAGQSPNGEADENLVGRIPKTQARSTGRRKKE